MKLNSSILKDFLEESYPVKQYGRGPEKLTLERPVFYTGENNVLKDNRVYLSVADQLPRNPVFAGNVVLICVGTPSSAYISGSCVCLTVLEEAGLFQVFNAVQDIYDKFDRWESGLREILETTSDIQAMVDLSEPVLNNPIVVIDTDYVVQGHSRLIDEREEFADFRPDANGFMRQKLIVQNIWGTDTDMSMTKPFLVDFNHAFHFSMNLFDSGSYVGNISINFYVRPFRTSDNIIAQYLSAQVEKALARTNTLSYGGKEVKRNIFQALLKGYPISGQARQYMESTMKHEAFRCIRAIPREQSKKKLPVSYFCRLIEKRFPKSTAFEYENSILILNEYPEEYLVREVDEEDGKMNEVLSSMAMIAGISVWFSGEELPKLRYYYLQTGVAIGIGMERHAEGTIYYFEKYILAHMLYGCISELPKELLYPMGFKRLLAYDSATQTDYIETLRVYLDTNMNVAKSAERLYIHRSTFLERVRKIEKFLGVSLKDPEERLLINMLLRLLEIGKQEQPDADWQKPPENIEFAERNYKELEGLL